MAKPARATETRSGAWIPRALLTAALGICLGLAIVSRFSPSDLSQARLRAGQAAAPAALAYQLPLDTIGSLTELTKSYLLVRDRNIRLETQINSLASLQRRVERLELENTAYRRQLAAAAWPAQVVATGRVLSHGGGTYLKSILLAAGGDANVASGQAVASSAGLVGQVVSQAPMLSRVLLINDFSSRIPVVVDETATPAIAAGTNDDLLKLAFLPIDFEGKDGARVSTSGAGGLFPAGLPIGQLVISRSSGKPEYFLRPYADLTATGVLSVLRPLPADLPENSPLPEQLIDPNLSASSAVPLP